MDDLGADPRLPVVSFTGSGPVGWAIRDRVPRKHVTLELGGNAAAIVCADWSSDADIDYAALRIAAFGMAMPASPVSRCSGSSPTGRSTSDWSNGSSNVFAAKCSAIQ